MIILIPAYEPDEKLVKLVKEIHEKTDYKTLVIDDGSGEKYRYIFNDVTMEGTVVLKHMFNMGKGEALKTGFKYISNLDEEVGVVTADCDGQHLVEDIIRVGEAIKEHKDTVILGTRRFQGAVPLRSRLGNTITRVIFSLASGARVYDTQTGLRGFSTSMLPWLCSIKGSRYEYEMNELLEAKDMRYNFYEITINTVYIEENKSSHFNVIRDSISIYLPILKFSLSSVISALLDMSLLLILERLTSNLFLSVIMSRIISASSNYILNRQYVFTRGKSLSVKGSLTKYALLAVVIMLLNYEIMNLYILIGIPLFISKLLTEGTLFFFSYYMQRKYVFIKQH